MTDVNPQIEIIRYLYPAIFGFCGIAFTVVGNIVMEIIRKRKSQPIKIHQTPCPDLVTLQHSYVQIRSDVAEMTKTISNSIILALRDKEYKAAYSEKRRDVRKYLRTKTLVSQFAVQTMEMYESLSFSLCEDFINVKITSPEDFGVAESTILSRFREYDKRGEDILGETFMENFNKEFRPYQDEYISTMRVILLDKENDKVNRIHQATWNLLDKFLEIVRNILLN